jgi:hypothetical protein
MNRQQVIDYLRKSLDNNLSESIRKQINSYTYYNTLSIQDEVHEFEQVMKYIEENLK